MTRVSMVAPVYNEARVLPELARRGLAAVRSIDATGEVLLVDDASTDDTTAVARTLPDGVSVLQLAVNRGQLGATKAGLAKAQGAVIVVMDGDLQDPPETLPALVAALDADAALDVVFAVKRTRDDPTWFIVGRAIYGLLARLPGTRVVPSGAGSFCAMRAPVAQRIAQARVESANLAAVVVALGVRAATVPYDKIARVDGTSRIGAWGLVREAVGSLVLTGSLSWLLRLAAWCVLVGSWIAQVDTQHLPQIGAAILIVLYLAWLLDRRRRRMLAPEAR